jgi:uncharacterized protein YxjI
VQTADARTRRAKRRPAYALIIVVGILFRLGREVIGRVALDAWGVIAAPLLVAAGLAVALGWRYALMRRARVRGAEMTADDVVAQVEASGIAEPAFDEDGTILGASVLVVNQRTKVVEVETTYDIFDRHGERLGSVHQVGQSGLKRVARFLTAFDQYFTHRFEIRDADGAVVLQLLRPRKVFYTHLHVYGSDGRLVGSISQQNLFWKIRFAIVDATGNVIGHLRADNLRAWDFVVLDHHERPVARIFKSWEGWARATFTRADHFVLRVDEPLPSPLREVTIASAIAADLALKQDTRR